jgi:hypothetical protein
MGGWICLRVRGRSEHLYVGNQNFHVFWESYLRVGFFTPVWGRRGRWEGTQPKVQELQRVVNPQVRSEYTGMCRVYIVL